MARRAVDRDCEGARPRGPGVARRRWTRSMVPQTHGSINCPPHLWGGGAAGAGGAELRLQICQQLRGFACVGGAVVRVAVVVDDMCLLGLPGDRRYLRRPVLELVLVVQVAESL